MTNNESETTDELLDDLAVAKPGEILIFDEAQERGPKREMGRHLQRDLVKLTPELMQKRIKYLRGKLVRSDFSNDPGDS